VATNTPTVSSITFGGFADETPTATGATVSSAVTSTSTVTEVEFYSLGANDPLAPTSLQVDGQTNPNLLVVSPSTYQPDFSAVFNDPDVADVADKFQIQVSTDQTFSDVTHWNSNSEGTAMPDVTEGNRSSDLAYDGGALSAGTTFYWRVRFWDDEGHVGLWSTETASFTLEEIVAKVRVLGRTRIFGSTRVR